MTVTVLSLPKKEMLNGEFRAELLIGKVVPVYTINAYRGSNVKFYSCLTSALGRDVWSTPRPCRFTPGYEAPLSIGSLSPSGLLGDKRNLLRLPRIAPRFVQPVA
jgi:hypothetical protein